MKKGFTLIELIVVITIIAILTVVGVMSYSGVTKKSRDSRRMADLEKYRVALEMARQVGSTYPADLTTLVGMNLGLSDTLADPKAGFTYYYTSTSYTYQLWAQVEDPSSASSKDAQPNMCGGMCTYEVTNP